MIFCEIIFKNKKSGKMETKENGGSGGTKEYERVNCLVQKVMEEFILF